MQDYKEQAAKRNVVLKTEGGCQFCGAQVSGGVDECMEKFAELCGVEFSNPEYRKVHFLSVDAHALQHSEVHGKLNNRFHLLRLFLIFEQGTDWDFKKSPQLSTLLKQHQIEDELVPPPLLKRGVLTVVDVLKATNAEEHKAFVEKWSRSVYDSWKDYHAWAKETAQKIGI